MSDLSSCSMMATWRSRFQKHRQHRTGCFAQDGANHATPGIPLQPAPQSLCRSGRVLTNAGAMPTLDENATVGFSRSRQMPIHGARHGRIASLSSTHLARNHDDAVVLDDGRGARVLRPQPLNARPSRALPSHDGRDHQAPEHRARGRKGRLRVHGGPENKGGKSWGREDDGVLGVSKLLRGAGFE